MSEKNNKSEFEKKKKYKKSLKECMNMHNISKLFA